MEILSTCISKLCADIPAVVHETYKPSQQNGLYVVLTQVLVCQVLIKRSRALDEMQVLSKNESSLGFRYFLVFLHTDYLNTLDYEYL